jgi:leader peptidase (prepilin peptidase)/N-methyltransferase
LVELAMGTLALGLFHQLSGGPLTMMALASPEFILDVVAPFAVYLVFVAALVAVTFIDLDYFIIPDRISLPGIPLGIASSAAVGHAIGIDLYDSLIGAALGAGVIIMLIVGYAALRGREGMGGGDWKLLGMIGAWLGWQSLPFVLLLSSVQGIALVLLFGRAFAVEELPPEPGEVEDDTASEPQSADSVGQLAIPFGPFLSLAALELLLFGEEIHRLLASTLSLGP